jgi:uncharacterized membrane protein
MTDSTNWGPIQMLVVNFEGDQLRGEILPELRRLRDRDIVRLIDLLVVVKGYGGDLQATQTSDLTPDEAREFGAVVGALIGLGAGGDAGAAAGAEAGAAAFADGMDLDSETVWDVAERIPIGGVAAIALIEHRWAIPLRDAIARAHGTSVVDEWVHPADLVGVGLEAEGADHEVAAPGPPDGR